MQLYTPVNEMYICALFSAKYGWSAVFSIIIGLNVVAAILAMFVLKPLRLRYLNDETVAIPVAGRPAQAA